MKKGYDGTALSIRLKSLMHENETTQQKLAELLGISRQSVAQYLDCSAQPSIDKLYKLAEYFNCSTDYLLGLSGYRNYKEWADLHEALSGERDYVDMSSFGIDAYRHFMEFSGIMDNLNNELGYAASMNKFLVGESLYMYINGIFWAYKTAIEGMSDVCSNRTEASGLIKDFIYNLRQVDNSHLFVEMLLEHKSKMR